MQNEQNNFGGAGESERSAEQPGELLRGDERRGYDPGPGVDAGAAAHHYGDRGPGERDAERDLHSGAAETAVAWWPLVWRWRYDRLKRQTLFWARKVAQLQGQVEGLRHENRLLAEALKSLAKPQDSHAQRERRYDPLPTGRGGWRAKAEAATRETFPKPADSVEALEKRVEEQKRGEREG